MTPKRDRPTLKQIKDQVERRNDEIEKKRRTESASSSLSDESKFSLPAVTVTDHDGPLILSCGNYEITIPKNIKDNLYPHQKEGLNWLLSLHTLGKGGLLGDDMGLGKTRQICTFLAGLLRSKMVKRVLIVAPKTLISQWSKELEIVNLDGRTWVYLDACTNVGKKSLSSISQEWSSLTTYDVVCTNSSVFEGGPKLDYLILDEGHLIKNDLTARSYCLHKIYSSMRIVITGTPIQNKLEELWTLFDFCSPGLLGTRKDFQRNYVEYIDKGIDKNSTGPEVEKSANVAEILKDRIRPFFLRRLKSEVLSFLPKKEELVVWLRLSNTQRKMYRHILKNRDRLSSFPRLAALKSLCNHPLLEEDEESLEEDEESLDDDEESLDDDEESLDDDEESLDEGEESVDEGEVSCKLSFLISMLEKLLENDHRMLIFSHSKKMLDLIEESLNNNGHGESYLRMDGDTSQADRVEVVARFQEEDSVKSILLLTSNVGGLGITLTNADRVFLVDPDWNPSVDNQCVDRAYRLGQKKCVLVFRLITASTIEESIYKRQIYKSKLILAAIEAKKSSCKASFTKEELTKVFSANPDFETSVTFLTLKEQFELTADLQDDLEFIKTLGILGTTHHSTLFQSQVSSDPAVPTLRDSVSTIQKNQLKNRIVEIQRKIASKTNLYEKHAKYAFDRGAKALDAIALLRKEVENLSNELENL